MQNTILEILNGIPQGKVFDSHYIISQLIKYHSDAYLAYAGAINTSSDRTFLSIF